MSKKLICLILIAILLIPAVAMAKNYDAYKVYSGEISLNGTILKAGDQLTTSNGRITVETYYMDALGKKIEEGKGSIKSVIIDGEKVTEWVLTERQGAVIQIGNMIYQAALGFTLKPAYTAADSEGYYSILDKTFKAYAEKAKDKKVKFTGTVAAEENGFLYVLIAEGMIVATKTEDTFSLGDRISCKGTISDYSNFQGASVPVVVPDELSEITSVSARIEVNDLYLRNSNGSVITSTKKGDTIVIMGYDSVSDMFIAEYGTYSGYIKGTGLNISRDELLKNFDGSKVIKTSNSKNDSAAESDSSKEREEATDTKENDANNGVSESNGNIEKNQIINNPTLVGSYVVFGTYPQTTAGTDNSPIEWLVIDYDSENNKSLLISRYALDSCQYHSRLVDMTWEKCSLRSWLNDTFFNKAFTTEEQKVILETTIDNTKAQGYKVYSTYSGKNTLDKVFLLSYSEAWKYFETKLDRQCTCTDYAEKQGARLSENIEIDGRKTCWWLLRSAGYVQTHTTEVNFIGERASTSVNYEGNAVRPAIWVDLNNEFWMQ